MFRDMPGFGYWNIGFPACVPNGLLACCAAMNGGKGIMVCGSRSRIPLDHSLITAHFSPPPSGPVAQLVRACA